MRVPASDELFRPTAVPDRDSSTESPSRADTEARSGEQSGEQAGAQSGPQAGSQQVVELPATKKQPAPAAARTPSGRVKHDEKMTVYVTADELLDIEHARLEMRRSHGLAVDRGRLVRAAVAMALADLDAHGEDSALLRRLREA